MDRKSYKWFEVQRESEAVEMAQKQIVKALATVTLLHRATQSFATGAKEEADKHIQELFQTERDVDNLRRGIFKELSALSALPASYREDILHLVKRLDTLADHVKDAARCLEILRDTQLPQELMQSTLQMTATLVECASILGGSIEKISIAPAEAVKHSFQVEETESKIDDEYIEVKKLIAKYGGRVNPGALIIFDDLVEFIEQAADMCADTADYIRTLSGRV